MIELLSGLKYLKDKGIAHKRITIDTVMLTKDYSVKIQDFKYAMNVQ